MSSGAAPHGDARDTIYKTDYKDGAGTRKLTNYMGHDGQPVRDRTGRDMSDDELERFNDRAEGRRNRHIILSPDNRHDLTDAELDRATRRYMSDLIEDRPTADYVYSIHDDKPGERDIHVAMTASDRTDLELYPDDIVQERERAHEHYQAIESGRGRSLDREQEQEQEQALEQEQEQEQERTNERDRDREIDMRDQPNRSDRSEPEREQEQDRDRDRDLDRGMGR